MAKWHIKSIKYMWFIDTTPNNSITIRGVFMLRTIFDDNKG